MQDLANKSTLEVFDVESFTDLPTSDLGMETLVVDPDIRDIVQAVCQTKIDPWKIDHVANKGEGQIVLLHGELHDKAEGRSGVTYP